MMTTVDISPREEALLKGLGFFYPAMIKQKHISTLRHLFVETREMMDLVNALYTDHMSADHLALYGAINRTHELAMGCFQAIIVSNHHTFHTCLRSLYETLGLVCFFLDEAKKSFESHNKTSIKKLFNRSPHISSGKMMNAAYEKFKDNPNLKLRAEYKKLCSVVHPGGASLMGVMSSTDLETGNFDIRIPGVLWTEEKSLDFSRGVIGISQMIFQVLTIMIERYPEVFHGDVDTPNFKRA